MSDKIVKIYDISTIGADDTLKDLEKINKKFLDIKKSKLSLNGLKTTIEDPEELKKVDKQLTDLLLKEKQLATELKQKQVEMKQYQLLAAAEREEKKKQAAGNQALAGSYNEINKKYKELLALSKNTTNLLNAQEVKEAQTELKRYKDLLDNFSRGLTKDGTLVGEYTTGILQAFKNSGLDNIIDDQLKKAKQNVTDLDKEFEQLKQELSNVRVTGQGSLEVVEKQLIDNRKAAEGFKNQIDRVENELRNMSNTGATIANSIGLQFKNLKRDMASFVFGFVGFQALLGKLNTEITEGLGDAKKYEGIEQAFERLNRPGLLENLREATRGTVKDLDLMKAAVQANNFQIPLEQLGGLFEFAKQRAQDTGESVDFLVQSIILGIGRKSPLILDNLGISAVRLKENLKGVATESADIGAVAQAVGNIIREENAKTKGATETQTAELERNKIQWQNLRAELATKLLPTLIKISSLLVAIAGLIAAVPFGLWVTGITGVTAALALYRAEQIRSYIATQIATREGLIYRAYTITQAVATRVLAIATKAATYEIVLFNGAIRMTPLGLMLTLLTIIVPVMTSFGQKVKSAKNELDAMNDIQAKANKKTNEQIGLINSWMAVLKSSTASIDTKKKAMEELVKIDTRFSGVIKDNIVDLGKLKTAYDEVVSAINKKARTEAAQELTASKYKDLLKIAALKQKLETEFAINPNSNIQLTQEEDSLLSSLGEQNLRTLRRGNMSVQGIKYNYNELLNVITSEESKMRDKYLAYMKAQEASTPQTTSVLPTGRTISMIQKELKDANENFETAIIGSAEYNQLKTKIVALQKELDLAQIDKTKSKNDKASNLSTMQKDAFKDFAAARDIALAEAEKSFTTGAINEETYLTKIRDINLKFYNEKLGVLKGANAEERKEIAETQRDKEKLIRDTNEKIYRLDLENLERRAQLRKRSIENQKDAINNDPSLTESEKLEKSIELDRQLIENQVEYMTQMDALEKLFNISSTDNADQRKEALLMLQNQLSAEQLQLYKEKLNEFEVADNEAMQRIQRSITSRSISILTDKNSGPGNKERRLKDLEREGAKELETERLAQIDRELTRFQNMLDSKLISQLEYNQKVSQLETERLNIVNAAADRELQLEKTKNAQKEQFLNAGYQIADKFVNAYIQKLNMQADADYNAARAQLDIEREKRLEYAQSRAEREAIDAEFDAKAKEAERQRNIERQEIARKQLSIEFAVASIKAISTATSTADGLAKLAVVAGEYFSALYLLNSQQFAYGGKVKPERLTDGLINARPNAPITPHGDNVLAYVKPGEVILNKYHQQALGGDRTFAAIGVPGFNSMASSVQPPVFRSYFNTGSGSNGNSSEIQELKMMISNLVGVIASESYKPVLLDTNMLRSHQAEQAKKINLATL